MRQLPMARKFMFFLNSLVVAWVLLGWLCLKIPHAVFWPAGFVALSLPVALLLNFLFLLYWLFKLNVRLLLPLAVVVLGWGLHTRGFGLRFAEDEAPEKTEDQIRVLSYNVRIFNTYAHLQDKNLRSSRLMIEWIAKHPADIFCLQEYYNEPDSRVFNSKSKIGKNYHKESFISTSLVNHIGAEFGLAIFSKYPIINKGTIKFGKLTQNHAMYADIKLPSDTLRVYNFHFQSMSIEEKDIDESIKDEASVKTKGKKLLRRFKRGFVARNAQVDTLVNHIKACPYPVIICGDLNDLPYSYTYDKLERNLDNAFANKGSGFGSTYNGKIPFLRIDNQFFSDQLEIEWFKMHDTITWSDHFPNEAVYRLK